MDMKLVKSNIDFIKRSELNGVTYCWFVVMKSHRVSDSREYINYDGNRTCVMDYSINRLPAAVRAFIQEHSETLSLDNGEYKEYTILWNRGRR